MAMVEAVADIDAGCWGGAPRGLYDLVEQRLIAHGFLNGHADAFDERWKHDMFGWEFIDQGINVELMWVTYQQMKEFLEHTDAESYDRNFGDDYHGNEWVQRCDTHCYGKTCGVCDATDLGIRRGYIQGQAEEVTVDLNEVNVIDQRTVAMKVRARVVKAVEKRFVPNDHFRYALRRASARAGFPITKRTVRFASDAIKFKDFTSGADFVEFGLLRRMTREQIAELVPKVNHELGANMQLTDWTVHPASAAPLRQDVDLRLFDLELEMDRSSVESALARWRREPYVKMIIRELIRTGMARTEVNAKEYVQDLWLVRRGASLHLRMLLRGEANPYEAVAALFEKRSWIEAAKYAMVCVEAFAPVDENALDFFRPACIECGVVIPVNLLDRPFDPERCPRCLDQFQGALLEVVSA
jgi:hypothetical protein